MNNTPAGRNLGDDGAAARVRGSGVIDPGKCMTKILNVDPDDYACLLEPSVSFYALYKALKEKGFAYLWIDNPDLLPSLYIPS